MWNCWTFFQNDRTIHTPAIYECSNFSASLPELDLVCIFNFSLYGRCEVVSLCALICISLMTNNLDHLFFSLFFKWWKYTLDLENKAQTTVPLYITTIFYINKLKILVGVSMANSQKLIEQIYRKVGWYSRPEKHYEST